MLFNPSKASLITSSCPPFSSSPTFSIMDVFDVTEEALLHAGRHLHWSSRARGVRYDCAGDMGTLHAERQSLTKWVN